MSQHINNQVPAPGFGLILIPVGEPVQPHIATRRIEQATSCNPAANRPRNSGMPYRERGFLGEYPPRLCSCGEADTEICCTFASYDDGSTDGPTCRKCCSAVHGPVLDRSYSPD